MSHQSVIFGTSRGIGLEVVRLLARRPGHIIAVCRKPSRELRALEAAGRVELQSGVDITDRQALAGFADRLDDGAIDMLMVVAGVLERVELDSLDAASIQRQFAVNALGPLQTVAALRTKLRGGGKIGLVTSRMGSLGDNGSGGSYGYRMSKAALNMAGRCLAHDLEPQGVAVALLHPGWVRTEMTRPGGNIEADEAARGLLAQMDALTLAETGCFVHQTGEVLPW